MSLLPFASPPGGGGGTSLPSQVGNAGKFLQTNGTTPLWAVAPGGGGAAVAPSYFQADFSSEPTTTYAGANPSSALLSDANWNVVKTIYTGLNRDTRTVYTATGIWNNRTSLTYTTSLAYTV